MIHISSFFPGKNVTKITNNCIIFPSRHYAQRRVRDGFRDSRNLSGSAAQERLQFARENLEVIKRQVSF